MADRDRDRHRRGRSRSRSRSPGRRRHRDDDASGIDRARRLLAEQERAFKRGGAALENARAQGIGFLYDEDGGQLQERDKPQEERLEDAIPDLPENAAAREFLKSAPTKGLFMPLGKEVKVMQCWRCKGYGHRTGDRECPLFLTGNLESDARRQAREDPMSAYVGVRVLKQEEKEARRAQLQAMVDQIRAERKEKKRRRKERKRRRREKRKKEEKKRRKRKGKEAEGSGSGKRRRSGSKSDSSRSSSSESSSSDSESRGSDSSEDGGRKGEEKKAKS